MMTMSRTFKRTMRVAETRNDGTELWLRDYKLAEMKKEKLYRYIDDIDSFKNVDECDAAYADVEEFENDWCAHGATIWSDDFVDFDNNLEEEAEKCMKL